MKKTELTKTYKRVAKEIGFKEDPTHKGWMPKLGPNDYKSKIVHGFIKKEPVTLTVGPAGLVGRKAIELFREYDLAEKKNKLCVILPKVWNFGNYADRSWLVRERVNGKNPLSGLTMPAVSKREIAEMYWNTVSVFSEMEERDEHPNDDFENFFRDRLNKWLETGGKSCKNKRNRQKLEALQTIAFDVFRYIFYESGLWDSADLEMGFFFKNFGNTDVVLQDGKFYLPSPEIIPLPEFYGTSYFVWNMLMYSYDRHYENFLNDIEVWRAVFKVSCPDSELQQKFDAGFYCLLFERVIATLLVDITSRRSPFDIKGKEGKLRAQKAEIIFVEVLKYLLKKIPTLVKNEPFKENFEALKKIYK